MKIGIDIRMINHSGIGTYINNLVPLIIKKNPKVKFYLIYNKKNIVEWKKLYSNTVFVLFNSKIYSLSEQFEFYKINKYSLKLFWSPHYNFPIMANTKVIVTVHDILHLVDKDLSIFKKMYSSFMFFLLKRKASKIIADSQFTKSEIINYLKVENDLVDVIYLGIDKFFEKKHQNSDGNFLLYVGNIKKHKNLKTLLKAFNLLNDTNFRLYIVGEYQSLRSPDNEVLDLIAKNDNILLKGRVDNEKLREYYSNAQALIFPSLYEGFGLPPLEAMACGCPVIASDKASIPEICSDAVLYFKPIDVNGLVKQINTLLSDDKLKNKLIKSGYIQSEKYSWDNSADKIIYLIRDIIE